MLNFRENIHKIKFYGALEQEKEKKNQQSNILTRRLIILLCIVVTISSIMAARLAYIQFSAADELAV